MGLDPEVKRLVGIAAKGYLAEMEGRFCQCSDPDIDGPKASLCFRCGLVNQERKRLIGVRMRGQHPYEAADPDLHPGLARAEWCAFCSYPKADSRHRESSPATGGGGELMELYVYICQHKLTKQTDGICPYGVHRCICCKPCRDGCEEARRA